MKKKHLTLQQKLTLSCCTLLVGVLVLMGAALIPERLLSYNTELDDRITLTARLVAESSDVREALAQGKASEELIARLDADAAETEGVDYIVIADSESRRIYHPDHSLIGQQFAGGDEGPAIAGQAPYLTTRHGTSASQRRAFRTVYDEQGRVLGFVMASASLESIQKQKEAILIRFCLVFALALAVGLLMTWLLSRSVYRSLLGHEPRAFARMYLQREDVLDHLSEALLAISKEGRPLFRNASARSLVGDEPLPERFPLWPEIRATLADGQPRSDLLTEWGERTFLAKVVPMDKTGVLLILRDRTEYTRIDQQLTGTNHIIEALRANTHEFLNRLHIISGLLQIGETQKAIEFISSVSSDVEDNYQSIVRQLQNRTIAALVLGKASHAREMDIQFSLRRDSTLPLHSAYLSSRELVTIVGNLVENAFEAVNGQPLRQVGLFIGEDEHGLTITVDDTGHGMTEEQIATVRARQYTTKGDGHGFGLRLIQQIVADRKGYLEIESEPGEGSAFTVNFTMPREVPGQVPGEGALQC